MDIANEENKQKNMKRKENSKSRQVDAKNLFDKSDPRITMKKQNKTNHRKHICVDRVGKENRRTVISCLC